jgi:molecular chaperone DnaK (HSP70)
MLLPAIDAGNGRFKIAVPDSAGNQKLLMTLSGQPFFPAVVYFDKDGQKIIGIDAENAALADPQRGVFNWKRQMGTDKIQHGLPPRKTPKKHENGKSRILIADVFL